MKYLRALSIVLVLISLNSCYFGRALVYLTADIDDYKKFANNTVVSDNPIPWDTTLINQKSIDKKDDSILNQYQSVAFLVIQNDKLIFERYFRGHTYSSISNCFSVSKSIVSLLIGIAIDEGKIHSVHQKVSDYLPKMKNYLGDSLTIQHLLTMSAGLDWNESYANPFSPTTRAYYGRYLNKMMNKTGIASKPGEHFDYQSMSTQILGAIVRKATNKSLSEYASEKLWKPLGAEHNALWSKDRKKGTEKAYCCFTATARDFAKIGNMVLHKGKFGNQQIVSESYINESLRPALHLKDKYSNSNVDFYGYQWWILKYKNRTIPYARGINGQYIFVIRDKQAVVVRLGNKRAPNAADAYQYLDIAFKLLD